MQEALKRLEEEGLAELRAAQGEAQVQAVRTKYLGRKGLIDPISSGDGEASGGAAPGPGQLANQAKSVLEEMAEEALEKERSRQKTESMSRTGWISAFPVENPSGEASI